MTEHEITPLDVPGGLQGRRLKVAAVAAVIAIVVAGVLLLTAITRNSEKGDTAVDALQALCALRTDVQLRVDAQTEFLADHPNGIPGVSATVIQDGINSSKRTVAALSTLDCPSTK